MKTSRTRTSRRCLLTKAQVDRNDRVLDEIEDHMQHSGSDLLFDGTGRDTDPYLTDQEFQEEWKGYVAAIRRIKRWAEQLHVPTDVR